MKSICRGILNNQKWAPGVPSLCCSSLYAPFFRGEFPSKVTKFFPGFLGLAAVCVSGAQHVPIFQRNVQIQLTGVNMFGTCWFCQKKNIDSFPKNNGSVFFLGPLLNNVCRNLQKHSPSNNMFFGEITTSLSTGCITVGMVFLSMLWANFYGPDRAVFVVRRSRLKACSKGGQGGQVL